MFTCHRLALVVLASFVSPTAFTWADDESYDLRGPAIPKGLVIRETASGGMKDAKFKLTLGARAGEEAPGLMIEGSANVGVVSEREIKVLAIDDRDVIKLETKLNKYDIENKFTIMGNEQKDSKKKELVGATIVSEFDKAKKKWKHSLKEGEPTEAQKKELDNFEEWLNEDLILPPGKVKIGQSWDNTAAALGKKIMGSKFSNGAGKGKSKLLRLEKVGDEQCAVIETEMEISGRCRDEDNQDLTISMKGKLLVYRSLARGAEVKSSYALEGTMSFTGEKMGQNVDIRFEGKLIGEGKTTFKNP